jgi:hypothetical protein
MSANVHSGWPLQKNGRSVRPKPMSYGGRGSRRLGHDIEMFAGTPNRRERITPPAFPAADSKQKLVRCSVTKSGSRACRLRSSGRREPLGDRLNEISCLDHWYRRAMSLGRSTARSVDEIAGDTHAIKTSSFSFLDHDQVKFVGDPPAAEHHGSAKNRRPQLSRRLTKDVHQGRNHRAVPGPGFRSADRDARECLGQCRSIPRATRKYR